MTGRITGPPGATGPTGVQAPTETVGATGFMRKVRTLEAREEYHTEMPVRRYDLVHVKEDLQHCHPVPRWIPGVASGAIGVAATALLAGIAGLYSTPVASLTLRVIYFGLAIVGALAAVGLFKIDNGDHTRATESVANVESRLDELIRMFPAGEEP